MRNKRGTREPSLAPGPESRAAKPGSVGTPAGQEMRSPTSHRYKVGQSVSCKAPFGSKPLGPCKVTAVLPPLGEEPQYRIRSENEAFERVAVEHQLGVWKFGER